MTSLSTSREASPRYRLPALDLARGLAVLFMVFVHVLEEWATVPLQRAPFGRVVELLGSAPAAPVFMFLMGASVALSRRSGPLAMARRGLRLLLLGFLLNFLRGSLPAWIGLRLGVVEPEALAPYTPSSLFWIVDVLAFAGLALAILGVVRLVRAPWAWVTLALAVTLVAPSLWGTRTGQPIVDGALRHLWGADVMVSFPLFPWLAYPLVGMAFGTWLTRYGAERVFRDAFYAGLALMAATTSFVFEHGSALLGNHWRLEPAGVLFVVGFVMVWLSLCRWALRVVPPNPLFSTLFFWSRNVTRFYFAQWLIVAWGTGLAGHHALGLLPTMGGQLGVVLLAHVMTRAWVRFGRVASRGRDGAGDHRLS